MSPTPPPPRASAEHPLGERPLKPPVRRGPWRALAMLGGLAAAVAGLAWLTGTMPSGLDLAASPPAASAPGAGATPAASSPALASASRPAATAVAASSSPSASMLATTPPPRAAVPLPPMAPEARLAAAPTAAGPVATAMAASVAASVAPPSPAAPAAPVQTAVRGQSQLQAAGGLDLRLRKALDGEGIAAIVEVDPANGHVLVADPQAERALRDRTDMLIRAVYAGASLPEPQIEHRWLSPMHGDRNEAVQAQAPAPASPAPPTPARAQPQQQQQQQRRDVLALAPPAAGLATKHVQSARAGDRHDAGAGISLANVEELRPVLPSGRFTAGCMEDIAGKTTNRRAALTVCMKHSCCSSSANLNSEECRAYQKAYPYTCSAG